VGCGGATSDGSSGTEEDLTSSNLAGYYEFTGPSLDSWIEQLALHADGSFEANIGSDVSNLSGHHFQTTGTFDFKKQGGTNVLSLHALGDFAVAGSSSYDVSRNGNTITLKEHGGAASTAFHMQQAKLVTITFNADWTITQSGPIVANAPFLVRYAASRDDCPIPQGGGLDLTAFGQFDNGAPTSITFPFNSQPVKGFLAMFGFPAQGDSLAVWFKGGAHDSQDVSTSCTHWDSNLGKNYHFTVAAH
jgi:hypothetical protein